MLNNHRLFSDRELKPATYDPFSVKLKKLLHADQRYSVLDFRSAKNFLIVFTDSISSAIRISNLYRRLSSAGSDLETPFFKIKIVLLPDNSVGQFIKGVCHVGVAPVRSDGDSSSEQITQILYGEGFDTLQMDGDWIRARLHLDGYVGWVSSSQVTLFTENEFDNYRSLRQVIATEKLLPLFEKPVEHSNQIREALLGNRLAITGQRGNFFEVKLPDGSNAYAKKSGVAFIPAAKNLSLKRLLETALSFKGISYVWGGRSPKGFDCSGFVQTVFRLNGVELPRDANEQFLAGKAVGKGLKKLRPGDLLFFSSNGNKINHVAIFLVRNGEFIHSSGFVRINSLDPRNKNFSKRLFSNFIGACRIIY